MPNDQLKGVCTAHYKYKYVSLESEKLVVVQLLLFLSLSLPSVPQPPPPLLRVQREADHQAGLEQVTGPTVDLGPLCWKVAHWTADCCGNGIRCCAVPESENS